MIKTQWSKTHLYLNKVSTDLYSSEGFLKRLLPGENIFPEMYSYSNARSDLFSRGKHLKAPLLHLPCLNARNRKHETLNKNPTKSKQETL